MVVDGEEVDERSFERYREKREGMCMFVLTRGRLSFLFWQRHDVFLLPQSQCYQFELLFGRK